MLLLDEPTTGVDPVSRREFWDALADLSSHGITIVIATPYLDEAERCTRIALMYDGTIHQTGTPRELRDSLGLRRLVVRTSDLSKAEDLLHKVAGIEDAQRFGDRLDVMVEDEQAGEKITRETLEHANLEVNEISCRLSNARKHLCRNAAPKQWRDQRRTVSGQARPSGTETETRWQSAQKILARRFGDFLCR